MGEEDGKPGEKSEGGGSPTVGESDVIDDEGHGLELRLVQELEGHSDRVWSVAWSPAGGLLASCSGDKSVRIWEKSPSSHTWTCKAVLEETHTRTVRSSGWSPSGRLLATASFDATTGIWETMGGEFECIATLEGHENEVKSVAWNSSGMLLATCSRDKHVWIWEVQPGNEFECMSVLAGHTQDVKMVTWHPARDILVSSSYDNSIKVWKEDGDGDDWCCVQTLAEPGQIASQKCVLGHLFVTHTSHIASGRSPSGHTSTVWGISFNSEGDRLVSCSDDLTLMVWDTSTAASDSSGPGHTLWKHLYTISGYHDRTIFSVHWSRSNGLIASGSADDCIRIFAEAGKQLLVPSGEGSAFELVAKKEKAHSTDVNCVQWHPKAALLCHGVDKMSIAVNRSSVSVATGALVSTIEMHTLISRGSRGATVVKSTLQTSDVGLALLGKEGSNAIDPRLLASAGDDGVVKIWELLGDLKLSGAGSS